MMGYKRTEYLCLACNYRNDDADEYCESNDHQPNNSSVKVEHLAQLSGRETCHECGRYLAEVVLTIRYRDEALTAWNFSKYHNADHVRMVIAEVLYEGTVRRHATRAVKSAIEQGDWTKARPAMMDILRELVEDEDSDDHSS